MEPPVRFRVAAPKAVVPDAGRPVAEVMPTFLALQDRFQEHLAAADGLDLGRVLVRSPPSKYVKLSLEQAFVSMAAHQRRHLWQARGVREAIGARPASS